MIGHCFRIVIGAERAIEFDSNFREHLRFETEVFESIQQQIKTFIIVKMKMIAASTGRFSLPCQREDMIENKFDHETKYTRFEEEMMIANLRQK